MGKKDNKHVDKAKLEAKKERKVSKQEKIEKKRIKKEISRDGKNEEDIETILADFAAKERARVAVTVRIDLYLQD
jgi:hypothetical protein